jgi:predicted dehydrogenase
VAIFGCGFWAWYQACGWREAGAGEIVALYNRTREKAEALAGRLGGGVAVYSDPEELLRQERPDVVDVITDVDTHAKFVSLAAKWRTPVICQKPLAPTLEQAIRMVECCRKADVPLLVHENWRWQAPVRQLKSVLGSGEIGSVHRVRVDFITGFDVFRNQPFLRGLERFILTDIGSHILDTARFLFGEARSVYCQTRRVHADIRGEDVASVMLNMGGATVTCNMAYAGNALEHDRFPETFVFAEGSRGSVELGPDYWVRTTTPAGTHARRHPPPRYPWADPAYEVVQASIVPCIADLAAALRGERPAETTGEDNLRTVRLVHAAYESAAADRVIPVGADGAAV